MESSDTALAAAEYLQAIVSDSDRRASVDNLDAYRFVTGVPTDGRVLTFDQPQLADAELTAEEMNWLEGQHEVELDAAKNWPVGEPMRANVAQVMDEYLARRLPRDWEAEGRPDFLWALWHAWERPLLRVGERVKDAVRRLFVTASELRPRRQRWLWEHRIPLNEVTLFAGMQGRGKSTMTMYWIAGVTRGSFGHEPVDVLLLSAEEDHETTIVPRLIAAGADMERVHLHRIERHFTLPRDVAIIEEAVRGWKVGLVVIDPLLSYLDDETDAYSPKEIRRALHALNVVKRTATIVALIHFRKESAQEVLHMITSSSAFSEVPRSVLGLGKEPDTADEDGRLVLVHLKCNVGRQQRPRLVRIGESWIDDPDGGAPFETSRVTVGEECDLTKEQVFKPTVGGRPSTVRDEAKEFLTAELKAGRGAVDVKKVKGKFSPIGSGDTLKRAANEMGLKAEHVGGTWYWREPDAFVPARTKGDLLRELIDEATK